MQAFQPACSSPRCREIRPVSAGKRKGFAFKSPGSFKQDLRPKLHLAGFHRGEGVLLITISVNLPVTATETSADARLKHFPSPGKIQSTLRRASGLVLVGNSYLAITSGLPVTRERNVKGSRIGHRLPAGLESGNSRDHNQPSTPALTN
jgi:hypothetical protein